VTDPAQRLLEIAEAEHRLATERRADELAALQADRDRALAALPAVLSAVQEDALRRAVALQQLTTGVLRAARDELAAELGRLSHGRTSLRAYAPAGYATAASVDATG
jgi:hypothetical protein